VANLRCVRVLDLSKVSLRPLLCAVLGDLGVRRGTYKSIEDGRAMGQQGDELRGGWPPFPAPAPLSRWNRRLVWTSSAISKRNKRSNSALDIT